MWKEKYDSGWRQQKDPCPEENKAKEMFGS